VFGSYADPQYTRPGMGRQNGADLGDINLFAGETDDIVGHFVGFIRRSARKANLKIDKVLYAFPAVPILGYTQVISLTINAENVHDY